MSFNCWGVICIISRSKTNFVFLFFLPPYRHSILWQLNSYAGLLESLDPLQLQHSSLHPGKDQQAVIFLADGC